MAYDPNIHHRHSIRLKDCSLATASSFPATRSLAMQSK